MDTNKMREQVGAQMNLCPDFWLYDERFSYDPVTGYLFWKPTGVKRWDTTHAGKLAGTKKTDKKSGKAYWVVTANNLCTSKPQHRIAWLLMTGQWPVEVDHKNGNGCDNRWVNLRDGGRLDNSRNHARRRDNRSGIPGVYLRGGRYRVIGKVGRASVGLGTFDTIFDAACAKKSFEAANGYFTGHGRSTGVFPIEAQGLKVEVKP